MKSLIEKFFGTPSKKFFKKSKLFSKFYLKVAQRLRENNFLGDESLVTLNRIRRYGFCEQDAMNEKSVEEMTFDEKVSWAAGELIISIGEGKFRDRLYSILNALMLEAYNRGKKEVRNKCG